MSVDAKSEAGQRIAHLVPLVLSAVAVQLLFWLVIKPLVIGTPNPGFDTIEGYDYAEAELSAPTFKAVEAAEFKYFEKVPNWNCCSAGYRAFRYSFTLKEIPAKGLGIAPHIHADNFAIYVNDSFVAGTGRMTLPDHTYDSMIRKTYQIPRETLVEGRNQVTFILVREGIPYFDYFAPILGEYGHIENEMAATNWLSDGYTYAVLAAISIVALFALIFFLISGRDRDALWIFILASALAASTHYYVWIDPPFDGHTRVAYFFTITLMTQFAWFGWADAWSRDRYRWVLPAALAVLVIAILVTLASLIWMPYGPGYDRAGEIMVYCGIAFAAATALRLLWNFRKPGEDRYLEAAIALLLVSLFAMQVITELTQALNLAYITRTQPFLILGIAVAFFARRVTLFRSSAQINSLLQSQLDERTEELAVAHDREKRLVRQQALDEERQRIMRDMHDGLGSHLMSMMMMAKRGSGKHSDYADGLQSVIDEMRLMIDSMDSVGESLRSALTVFRKRVVPKARDAGFTVDWQEDSETAYPAYSPRDVLQVFRILQEAITNALKHSGGDAITISVLPAKDGAGVLDISIADNGGGLTDARGDIGGRGLKNMKARAASIDAELDVQSESTGTSVSLLLSERA